MKILLKLKICTNYNIIFQNQNINRNDNVKVSNNIMLKIMTYPHHNINA